MPRQLASFKKSLINDVNLLKPSRYYLYGCRVLNVLHTRLRYRSSNLNADLFRVNLINDPGCVCGWVIEDAIHFFLECCLYVEAREQLTNNLQFLDSLLIETLLFGDDSLSEGKMHKCSNQCSCTSIKRNVLPHSDHTSYIEFNYFLLWTFSPLLIYPHEYDNSVLLITQYII